MHATDVGEGHGELLMDVDGDGGPRAYSTQGTHMGTFVTIWVPFRVVKYTGPTLSHPTDPAQTNHPWDPLSILNDGLALDGVAIAY